MVFAGFWVTLGDVILVPLMTMPITALSILLLVESVILALFILLHKGRGGG